MQSLCCVCKRDRSRTSYDGNNLSVYAYTFQGVALLGFNLFIKALNLPAIFISSLLLVLQLLASYLSLCSEQFCTSKAFKTLELTPQSLSHFSAYLKRSPVDLVAVEPLDCFTRGDLYPRPCLTYLIGSVIIFGHVDEDDLSIIQRAYSFSRVECLSDLADALGEKNDCDAVAHSIAQCIRSNRCTWFFKDFIKGLIKNSWNLVDRLIMKVLTESASQTSRNEAYYMVVQALPVKRQYEMLVTGELPLTAIDRVHDCYGSDLSLRELFALSRYSYNPSPDIRSYIVNRVPSLGQFLPNHNTGNFAASRSDGMPILNADAWYHVFRFLDEETLMFVLPLVCTSWSKLYLKILTSFTTIHDMYIRELNQRLSLLEAHTVAPWSYCLPDQASALMYFGRCIVDGALARVTFDWSLGRDTKEYLRAVIDGRAPLPKFRACVSQYDSFVRLFEMVCEYCARDRPVLDRPNFLTGDEYERAIRHFLREKKWVLELSTPWVAANIPKLFDIVEEDENLMGKLIARHFDSFVEPSVILILHRQTTSISAKLMKLIFSQTEVFRLLVGLEPVHPNGYYDLVMDRGIFPELLAAIYKKDSFHQFMVSFMLHFKNSPAKIDRIVASVATWASDIDVKRRLHRVRKLKMGLLRSPSYTDKCLPEDASLVQGVMARLGRPD